MWLWLKDRMTLGMLEGTEKEVGRKEPRDSKDSCIYTAPTEYKQPYSTFLWSTCSNALSALCTLQIQFKYSIFTLSMHARQTTHEAALCVTAYRDDSLGYEQRQITASRDSIMAMLSTAVQITAVVALPFLPLWMNRSQNSTLYVPRRFVQPPYFQRSTFFTSHAPANQPDILDVAALC